MTRPGRLACGLLLVAVLGGCATFDPLTGFSDVKEAVRERTGQRVVWNLGTELDTEAEQELRNLLEQELTADRAVRVALLSNRSLQALYADLGVAQADLVQAGLLRNPLFGVGAAVPVGGGAAVLELGAALDFLGVFMIPLRRRVAAAQFEDAKLRVTGAVLDFAAKARTDFYRHQASSQMLGLQQAIVDGLSLRWDVTQRLHTAGNISDLDLMREHALLEAAKLALSSAEMALLDGREQLNTTMGLWGESVVVWKAGQRLAEPPETPVSLEAVEARAVQSSLDLASARQSIFIAGARMGLQRSAALVPDIELGVVGEREAGDWSAGPTLEFALPLFDQGQARVGRAAVELRRSQHAYYALAVRIRSVARRLRERLQAARQRALYYRDIVLPLRERILNETFLHYNAMQLGVFQLLQAQERQIQSAGDYIKALRDYWLARNDLEHLLSGRLPGDPRAPMSGPQSPETSPPQGGH